MTQHGPGAPKPERPWESRARKNAEGELVCFTGAGFDRYFRWLFTCGAVSLLFAGSMGFQLWTLAIVAVVVAVVHKLGPERVTIASNYRARVQVQRADGSKAAFTCAARDHRALCAEIGLDLISKGKLPAGKPRLTGSYEAAVAQAEEDGSEIFIVQHFIRSERATVTIAVVAPELPGKA